MTDPDEVQRAREWLERQLADLGQLRNATRRDHDFKTWRQQTLTVIQRVWPGETRRVDRFRRIPFSPQAPHANAAQARDAYERGWGEAGVLLREFLAEVNLLGLPQVRMAGTSAGLETEAAMGPIPALGGPDARWPEAPAEPVDEAPRAHPQPQEHHGGSEIGRAMDRLLGRSRGFGGPVSAPPASTNAAPEPGSPAAELARIAGELEALGLSPERTVPARAALLALARESRSAAPPWELVGDVLAHAGATPALARRVLPLLHEFIARAA
jgi:hypothetical protein